MQGESEAVAGVKPASLPAWILKDPACRVQANAATTLSRFSSHNAQTAKAVATDATISRLVRVRACCCLSALHTSLRLCLRRLSC